MTDDEIVFRYEQQALPVNDRDCPVCRGKKVFTLAEVEDMTQHELALKCGAREPFKDTFRCRRCDGTGKSKGMSENWSPFEDVQIGRRGE